MLIKRQKGWRERQMCKKLLSLEPNVSKHLQTKFGPYSGRWIYVLPHKDFQYSVRAPLTHLEVLALGGSRTKDRRRNLEPFNFWKKVRFFRKWLHWSEKTNTAAEAIKLQRTRLDLVHADPTL